ncbi:hypothetical protein ILUMI_06640 [Ignelater luminosus]|uniref:Uncharacterized protein n=1 Tax=Ignelater luminosus TaxID=2038154 RepID=A0A8K0D9J7_IGNLU|nr:hypothetical protein ILUMI_06640 [Ignelater luminosus]
MYSRGKIILQAALSNLQNTKNNNPPNLNSCINKSLGRNIFDTVQDLQNCEGGVVNQEAVRVSGTDTHSINLISEENQNNVNEGQNLDCISSITTDEMPLVSENTTPVGVWCKYAVNIDGFLLSIPGKTETFGVGEIVMEYENNETDLEGTPEMTNKEVEVVEDSSVITVEHESSKSHLESTSYGDITKLSSTTNNTDSSIRVCERRVSRISKKSLKEKKRSVLELAYTGYSSERNSNDEDNLQPPAKISRRQSKMKGIKQNVHNEKSENVSEWLELLPKVPSHYCRSSSYCTYVESVFRSISHMHKVYEEWCGEKE